MQAGSLTMLGRIVTASRCQSAVIDQVCMRVICSGAARHACRLTDLKLSYGDVGGATGNFFNGQETMAQQLNAQGSLRQPFLFAPGEQYCYTNANFNVMGYVIEKVRGLMAAGRGPSHGSRDAEGQMLAQKW